MKEKIEGLIEGKYLKTGITFFLTGAALILFHSFVTNMEGVGHALDVINTILSPFIFGLIMAYLLCPIYNLVVRKTYHFTCNICKVKKKALSFSRVIATIISLFVLIGAVGGLFALVLPELIRSVIGIINNLPDKLTELAQWIQTVFADNKNPEITKFVEGTIETLRDKVMIFAQDKLMPTVGIYLAQISQGVLLTLKTMLNFLIGIIVCVYFLNSKEKFRAQTKKMIMATLSREKSDNLMEFAYFSNRTFGGFINGKIIDSIIMGILCFIVMSVIKLPYVMLVSAIVGVTNIIPFFGPFIGAIPGAIIICLVSPVQALYFLIMIFVLQQLDGNVIGPTILGGTTGLASFWVMFAIIVGGGLFGFAGMILGVPVFAIIYYYITKGIEKKLARKNLPVSTDEYTDFNKYDINRKDVL